MESGPAHAIGFDALQFRLGGPKSRGEREERGRGKLCGHDGQFDLPGRDVRVPPPACAFTAKLQERP